MNIDISIVIPVFNSEKTLLPLIQKLAFTLNEVNKTYEIILINDNSSDNSWNVLKNIVVDYKNIHIIDLLKNYGQHNAIFCGFNFCKGDYIVTLDDDLQNPPSEIPKMINKIESGYDLVFGKFISKQHNQIRKFGTKIIGYLNKKIFNKPENIVLSNFRIIRKEVIHRIIEYNTSYPYIPGLLLMFSNKIGNIEVVHAKREVGKSNYNAIKLLRLVARILFNYSSLPIRFVSIIGFIISFFSFILGLIIMLKNIIIGVKVDGWTTLVVLISFLGGYIILMLGMLGEYITRMNKQVSRFKGFVIKEQIRNVGN